ncbi:thioredoxin [Aquamicrobium defluvii]|uniref:Thioredoxin n=2 Tax=Aquamicrobium defluvii TaxID=69279 RepID=A0A011U872_9HYPH|nr:thioredoxin [Aquamicrobium defluvii]
MSTTNVRAGDTRRHDVAEIRTMKAGDHNVVCPHCAAVNRIAAGRDARPARCGSCKQKLFEGHPVDVDGHMYDRQVTRNDIPVLVDVWAPWCGPCRMMAPAFAQASAELEPHVRLIKLNSDSEPEVAGRLGIRGIPTMILFRGGKELARTSGAMTARQIFDWTQRHLGTVA